MSSISKYESLKVDGTSIDRIKYILSLSDKTEIEKHLKQSSKTSYDDLVTLIFLSQLTKNVANLLEIFHTDSLPVRQRADAGKHWIKLIKDEKQIADFLTQSINDENIPRYLKCQLLKSLHQIKYLKKSSSFFYDLTCRLTETNHHNQHNIDAHLVPFCTKDQILDLLSRWSLKRLEQIDSTSPFYSKLIRYQPLIIIHLIKGDLTEKKNDYTKFSNYFCQNTKVFESLAEKQAKELVVLSIEYLNQLEKHKRFLPGFIQSKQKYFFKKAPEQMIDLITIVAANQLGVIKYQIYWGSEGSELSYFELPRSFSVENYVRLFSALYDTCKWSSNHTIKILYYMLSNTNSYLGRSGETEKQRKWLVDIVIKERIGKDLFIKKLLKEGNEGSLALFKQYPEFTTPLSLQLLSQYERKGVVQAKQRLSLLRFQLMTQEIFDQFLSLFKQTGSDVNQRVQNYPLFFQCACSTNEQFVQKVLQWIEKRFTNEQLMVVEHFLSLLSSNVDQFHLQILPNNFQSIDQIINIGINHLQQTANTLQIIVRYGINLLKCVEYYSNKEQKEKIQTFAAQIIKRCYSKNENLSVDTTPLSESYPEGRKIIVDILISDVFPKLVSKFMLDELDTLLSSYITKAWRLPQIDSFLNTFFTETLPSSTKLQLAFKIDTNSMIELLLKNKSTRFERVKQLLKIDQVFFIDEVVQRVVLRSQQHRQLIDQCVQDDKCLTLDKLTTEESILAATLSSKTQNLKLPGLDIDLLNYCSHLLTGKQQEHITKIILNDYLQDIEVSNLNKLKSLRVLRRLTHTYDETLKWIDSKQSAQLATKNASETSGNRGRGAAAQPLDDLIICLPATFDLTPENLLKHFELLKTKLNSSNAKYISDAMLGISRKIPDEIFLKNYLEFIRNEEFQKLGVTATKEILRLLIPYVSNSSLIELVIKPLWYSRPHQDVRACLILTLLHFVGKSNSTDDQTVIWQILEKAAEDDYLPVIQTLFAAGRGDSSWPLSRLKTSSDPIYETFVNEIQFKILDHPTSLEARSYTWANIDYEHCNIDKLIEKAQQLCIQFDKDGNTLWTNAFQKILLSYKQQKISSSDRIINIVKKVMSFREEIDSKQNAIDHQHDLPVYHRIQQLLTNLLSFIDQFDNEKKLSFRSLTTIILQFDKTLSLSLAKLFIKIAQNKEDLENILEILQKDLPEKYFEAILSQLSTFIRQANSCPFIQQLNRDEKLQLAQWFIQEKNRPLFVFDLLKNDVFNQSGIDREQCQNLVRQLRQSENLFVRQQAMEYTVPWKEDGDTADDDDDDVDPMDMN